MKVDRRYGHCSVWFLFNHTFCAWNNASTIHNNSFDCYYQMHMETSLNRQTIQLSVVTLLVHCKLFICQQVERWCFHNTFIFERKLSLRLLTSMRYAGCGKKVTPYRILQILKQPFRIYDETLQLYSLFILTCKCQICLIILKYDQVMWFQKRQPPCFDVVKNIKQTRTQQIVQISFLTTKHDKLYFQCHIKCSKCPPLIHSYTHELLLLQNCSESLPTQRLHSHFVRMRHLSNCDCVSQMLIINKY